MAGERAFTGTLARFFGSAPDLEVGIGDDAAVVRVGREKLVLTCDPVVENVHFVPGTPWSLVGKKAVNRNLSDLAAMGAVPKWLLVSVLLPRRFAARDRRSLFLGIRAAARAARAVVVGGDTGTTRGPLVVTVTALGSLEQRALLRSSARQGDTLHVTGPLGGSILGKHLRFSPRIAEGRWLAGQRAVGAAMDVSDGLLLDLATMLSASGALGAELDAERIPVARDAQRLGARDPGAALAHALVDGEDYELLFTVRRGKPIASGGPLAACARIPIGRVVGVRGLWLCRPDGARVRIEARGYEHDL